MSERSVIGSLDKTNDRTCKICRKEFKNINSLKCHNSRKVCQKEKPDPLECHRCFKVFKNAHSRRSHMAKNICEQLETPNDRKCKTCGEEFKSVKSCVEHQNIGQCQKEHKPVNNISKTSRYVPKHLRREVWLKYNGKTWESKCTVKWCTNVYDFSSSTWHIGHNIPASKGGSNTIENLRPICSDCNLGMGNAFTIDEWDKRYI